MKDMRDVGIAVFCALAFAAFTAKAETVYDPDCVLYYDFETISDGKVVNLANPGTMDGTIVSNGGLAPELVEDSPAALIRQSWISDSFAASTNSLVNSITSADSRRNGYIECTPTH